MKPGILKVKKEITYGNLVDNKCPTEGLRYYHDEFIEKALKANDKKKTELLDSQFILNHIIKNRTSCWMDWLEENGFCTYSPTIYELGDVFYLKSLKLTIVIGLNYNEDFCFIIINNNNSKDAKMPNHIKNLKPFQMYRDDIYGECEEGLNDNDLQYELDTDYIYIQNLELEGIK